MEVSETQKRYLLSLGLMSGLCLAFFGFRVIISGTFNFWFVTENLALAWLSLLFLGLLIKQLAITRWLSWQNLALSGLWLFFLPNAWYVLTDFVHVGPSGEVSQLYDIVLVSSLVFCGFTLGFTSLYLMHQQLLKRLSANASGLIITLVIFISSFAIYIGRDLRWNTWDVVTNPSGLILNISDRIIDPFGHPRAINVTGLFFVLLGTMYLAIWLFLRPKQSRAKW